MLCLKVLLRSLPTCNKVAFQVHFDLLNTSVLGDCSISAAIASSQFEPSNNHMLIKLLANFFKPVLQVFEFWGRALKK